MRSYNPARRRWPELMSAESWAAEAQGICEGINHEDASECDPEEAARQLEAMSAHHIGRLFCVADKMCEVRNDI